jgi:hypothetical protein
LRPWVVVLERYWGMINLGKTYNLSILLH